MLYYIQVNPKGHPCLLFLHGLGATADSWHFQLEGLSERGIRLIAPDLPGFGRSHFTGTRWTLGRAVGQVIELMDQLSVARFFVAGISMGGAAALYLAYHYPARVEGLVLINAFASLKPGSLSEWSYFIKRGWRAFFRKPADQAAIVAERVFPAPDQRIYREILIDSIRSADPKVYRQAMLALARFNFTRKLGNIQTPVLIISGEEDTTIPIQNQRMMARMIPSADHVIIPGAGHAVIADQPDVVNLNISRFIEKVTAIKQLNPQGG